MSLVRTNPGFSPSTTNFKKPVKAAACSDKRGGGLVRSSGRIVENRLWNPLPGMCFFWTCSVACAGLERSCDLSKSWSVNVRDTDLRRRTGPPSRKNSVRKQLIAIATTTTKPPSLHAPRGAASTRKQTSILIILPFLFLDYLFSGCTDPPSLSPMELDKQHTAKNRLISGSSDWPATSLPSPQLY